MEYTVYRLSYTPNAGVQRCFIKTFKTKDEAVKYARRQHQLLTEYEELNPVLGNPCMCCYYYGNELRVVLTFEKVFI
jgi:hypothetical protein